MHRIDCQRSAISLGNCIDLSEPVPPDCQNASGISVADRRFLGLWFGQDGAADLFVPKAQQLGTPDAMQQGHVTHLLHDTGDFQPVLDIAGLEVDDTDCACTSSRSSRALSSSPLKVLCSRGRDNPTIA